MKTVYIADDGTEFENSKTCLEHELITKIVNRYLVDYEDFDFTTFNNREYIYNIAYYIIEEFSSEIADLGEYRNG